MTTLPLPPPAGAKELLIQIPVHADQPWNDVQCEIVAGVIYFFRATGMWWDASNHCDANGYNLWYLNPFKGLMRCRLPGATWFTLIGALDQQNNQKFVIGDGSHLQPGWQAPSSGKLWAFANDMHGMYWNNCGSITLEVWR